MKKDLLQLDNQICFPVYSLSRLIIQQYKPLLDPLDLTYLQYLVMMVLWEEEKITVKQLGERLYLDSGTLSPLLKKLEQKDYLNRQRRTSDERVVDISLTVKGKELKEKAQHIPEQLLCAFQVSKEEFEGFREQVNQMLNQLKPVS